MTSEEIRKLPWKVFEGLSAWLAEEITGNYIMNKKDYNNQPLCTPFYFSYRTPTKYCHETRTLFAVFIKQIFFQFWRTGKTTGFDYKTILKRTNHYIGLPEGYGKNKYFQTLCRLFVQMFPYLVCEHSSIDWEDIRRVDF